MNRLTRHVAIPILVALNAIGGLLLAGGPIVAIAEPHPIVVIQVAEITPRAETRLPRLADTRRLLTFPSSRHRACRGMLCARRGG